MKSKIVTAQGYTALLVLQAAARINKRLLRKVIGERKGIQGGGVIEGQYTERINKRLLRKAIGERKGIQGGGVIEGQNTQLIPDKKQYHVRIGTTMIIRNSP
ncbi:hypothetical protein ElyMa_004983500 [Elysia marginata]|uniref:Uncharacterized protein n=1 Tax=Elysia marginata TaxID=1093978 RepID=A0AAV4J6L0_9GAST|nr:hypothetical protein ElyMa_004983500 [Elysia marginata]